MINLLHVPPDKLKKEDKLNGHEKGWMTVITIKKGVKLPKGCFRNVTVTFDTASKKETIVYRTSELVEVIRDC